MTRPIIAILTDGRGDSVRILARTAAAAHAGIDVIQIREPSLPDRRVVELTRRVCEIAQASRAKIVVNDRLHTALAANAHGVHLRGNSYSADRARTTVPREFLIGRSVHDLGEAAAAEKEGGCDYLLFGTVFPSSSKPPGHRVAGLESLREVCARVRLPVIAIGGITLSNVADVIRVGAAGVAGISLFDDAESIPSVVDSLRRAFDT